MRLLKTRTVLGVICIVFSLLICFVLTPLYHRSVSQKTTVLRVVRDIQSGERIKGNMVQTVEVGGYNLPEDVMKKSGEVVGRYARADLSPGDYILSAKLSDSPVLENAYLYDLDGTRHAISVTIKSFAEGLSGKLVSGDIVSVIAPDYKKQGSTIIPTELTYVEVICVTASSGYDTARTDTKPERSLAMDKDEKQLPATVTFLASPEQAKILAELDSQGKIHLSLVYRGTTEGSQKYISIQDKLLKALYPKPAQNQDTASSAGGSASNGNDAGHIVSGGSFADSGAVKSTEKQESTTEEREGR